MNRSVLSRVAVGASTLVAAAGVAAVTGLMSAPANAADPVEPTPALIATYDASGSSHVAKSNFDVPLGPTKLVAGVYGDDTPVLKFNAALPLPPQTVSFKAFGYLPVRAKVYFTQVGPASGGLTPDGNGSFTANAAAKYVVTLRDVLVGYSAANVGDNCQTRYPIDVNVTGPKFDISGGGTLTGTYDLGKFNNCRTSTDLTNLIVSGSGNTIKLTLSNGTLADPGTPAFRQGQVKVNKLK